jgi:uncharacterized protein YdaU (DUF1376 family)
MKAKLHSVEKRALSNIDAAPGGAVHVCKPEIEPVPQMARMPWYPRDFASSTRGWPLVARGAYRELLDAQWDLGSLPVDPAGIRAIAGATSKEWQIAWPFIEPKLLVNADDRRRNARLEVHRRKAVEQFKKQSAGGRAGNAIKWDATK